MAGGFTVGSIAWAGPGTSEGQWTRRRGEKNKRVPLPLPKASGLMHHTYFIMLQCTVVVVLFFE